jgi:SAM-dependent methyltransferase
MLWLSAEKRPSIFFEFFNRIGQLQTLNNSAIICYRVNYFIIQPLCGNQIIEKTEMTDNKPGLWSNTQAYEDYMGRWSQKVAPLFLQWLDAPTDSSWIDIGCGTGGLTELIARTCNPSSVLGVDTAEGFIEVARTRVKNAEFHVGSADDLEVPDDSIDYAVSGLVLNFVPDPHAVLAEMARVVRPGGSVALYVWDYAGHMQIMRYFFDTAIMFDARSAEFDDGIKAPICRPLALKQAIDSEGLTDISVTGLDITTPFDNFDDYWSPFLGGVGSAPKYCVSLDESIRDKIKLAVKEKLPTGPEGEILLAARAWAIRGTIAN